MNPPLFRLPKAARLAAALSGALLATQAANADINLELRPPPASPLVKSGITVVVGDEFDIALYAQSDTDQTEFLAAIDAVLEWPSDHLELLGLQSGFMPDLTFEGFPIPGSSGLNESDPPADGDGLYIALASLGTPFPATTNGTLVTYFRFRALSPGQDLLVDIPPTGGDFDRPTIVYSGIIPNLDVTCQLSGITVNVNNPPCSPADLAPPFGAINFFDIVEYIDRYTAGDPSADLAAPFGSLNFFDVAAYLTIFNAGCP